MPNILVAALLATAINASAQDLQPGQKSETDGESFNLSPVANDDVKTLNSNMDTNFTPPPANGKSGGGKPAAGKPGNAGNPGGGAPAPAAKLSGVTGTVLIKTPTGTMTVKAGEPVPEIPAGAEIVVVSGEASVAVGGTVIKAGQGDSFTVNVGNSGSANIAVTAGSVSVVVNGVPQEVGAGKGVNVPTAAVVAAPAPAPATTETKDTNAESIPADSTDSGTEVAGTPASSPVQESASTVSPSAP